MLQQRSSSSSQVAVPQKELKSLVSFTTTHEVDLSSFFKSIATCQANVQVFTGSVMNASFMDASLEDIQFLSEVANELEY